MVSFGRIAIISLATIVSNAAPTRRHQDACLSAENAQTVATLYGELISAYSDAAADAILSTNFTDYSAGVNALINTCPQGDAATSRSLLSPTFISRDLFKIGQGQQPLINFEQLDLWYSCDSVTIRWKSTNTAPGNDVKPIIGLIVMETVKAPAGSVQPFLIDTVFSEFDSGSWLQNLAAAGICGSSTSVVGAPAPASVAHSSAAPVAAPTAAVSASSPSSMAAAVPINGTKVYETPTASKFRA